MSIKPKVENQKPKPESETPEEEFLFTTLRASKWDEFYGQKKLKEALRVVNKDLLRSFRSPVLAFDLYLRFYTHVIFPTFSKLFLFYPQPLSLFLLFP